MGPVRVGNDAWRQMQHDVYGSVVLAATQLFFDRRLTVPGDAAAFARLEHAGESAWRLHDSPMPGLWEFRGRARVHTYSSVMCWVACDRLARIAAASRAAPTGAASGPARADARARGSPRARRAQAQGHFVDAFDGEGLDASLLLLAELGFVGADDPRYRRDRRRDRQARCCAATTCSAMSRPTISARRRRASPSARSGTSTRSRGSAASTRRARCSRRCWRRAITLGLLSEDIHPAHRRAVGQLPADLFAGRPDQHRDATVAQLGKHAVAMGRARRRLQSRRAAEGNPRGRPRVGIERRARRARRALVRLERARRRRRSPRERSHRARRQHRIRAARSDAQRIRALLPRLRQPHAVAAAALPAVAARIQARRISKATCAVNGSSPSTSRAVVRDDDHRLGARLSPDSARRRAAQARRRRADRLLPAHPAADRRRC